MKTILFIIVLVAMLVTIFAMGFGLSDGETEKSYKQADICVYIVMGGMFVMFCAFMALLYVTELNINN